MTEPGPGEKELLAALEAEGWEVRCELIWRAVAVKGHDYEEATGADRAEALEQLSRLTGLDAVQGCP
jgi:hypothetical protein